MTSSSMRSELNRIKRKIGYDPNSFQLALKRHEAREYLALYTGWEHAPGFEPLRYDEAMNLLEGDTSTRWRRDQIIIMKHYAKHPPSPIEPPHPEWGLTPEEMRNNYAWYFWGEALDMIYSKFEEEFRAAHPDSPPWEPASDGNEFKYGQTWVKSHCTPEVAIKSQAIREDLMSRLENLKDMELSEELENREKSRLFKRAFHALDCLDAKLKDGPVAPNARIDGTVEQANDSPPKDS